MADMADEVRSGDRVRYLCAQFAPPAARTRLYAVTAFALDVARIPSRVREPAMGQLRVAWWREAVGRIAAGEPPPKHPVAEAVAGAFEGLSRAHFDVILDATEAGMLAPDGEEAGEAGAAAAGAALQLLWLEVLGVAGDDAAAAAGHAGAAWALAVAARAAGTRGAALAEEAQSRVGMARTRRVARAALPALLPAVVAADEVRRLRRGAPAAGPLRRQWMLLRAALLGRY